MTTRRSFDLSGGIEPTLPAPRPAAASAIGTDPTEPLPTPDIPSRAHAPQRTRFANRTLLNGRYSIERLLGQGGMGAVYQATDRREPHKPVALKTILAPDLTPTLVQLFMNEFKILSLFSHPRLVKVYDFDILKHEEQHFYFFTMEYVDGCNLFAATKGKTYREIAPLFLQVCEALQYVHAHRIIHGDLKPGNILVTRDGSVKLLDFGVSAQLGSQLRDPMGTPIYLAPEVITGGQPDFRVDIYGLGVILYEIVCGHSPFDSAASLSSIVEQKLDRDIGFSADDQRLAPEALRAFISRLCHRNPAQRFAGLEDVVDAFNRCGGTSYRLPGLPTPQIEAKEQEPFSGRERELARIQGFIDRRLQEPRGRALLLLIRGGKSIGKSRLLHQACRQARKSDLAAILLSCAPDTKHFLDEAATQFGQLAGDPDPTQASASWQVWAKRRACAVFLDDLQSAPRETVRFLECLLRGLADHQDQEPVPLAIVAACSARDLPEELAGLIEQAQHEGRIEPIRLSSRWAVV